MKGGRHSKLPPWRKPVHLFWFILALVFSTYLMLNMPESVRKSSVQKQAQQMNTEQKQTSPKAEKPIAQEKTDSANQNLGKTQIKNEKNTSFQRLIIKLQSFTRLFTIVGIAAFIGAIIELRSWHRFLAKFMGKLTRLARLPNVVGLAMPTALVSSAAANTMLITSHTEGNIRTSALIAGGMANSYVSYVSHSLRVMIPVIATIGLPGILFFSIQFSGGLLVILAVFIWNRWRVDHQPNYAHEAPEEYLQFKITSWNDTLKKSIVRAFSLLFRLICITVPLMLGIEWLLKIGAFDFWNELVPANIHKFFPIEAISIVATQIGGLIQSSAVAANLRSEGLINNAQILLAMLVASAVGNPIRSLRRNLATSLAIFPAKIACAVVFSMQFARIIVALLGVCGTVFYIQNL